MCLTNLKHAKVPDAIIYKLLDYKRVLMGHIVSRDSLNFAGYRQS